MLSKLFSCSFKSLLIDLVAIENGIDTFDIKSFCAS
jgi:hypothetical protein